jgi:ABC-type polysaccharide/polyol phosphate transport system ATPase subunit
MDATATPNCHIDLREVGLDFRLYKNKSFSLREWLLNSVAFRQPRSEFFTALNKVTLSIAQGERVALIGANGAGKSSLMKVIAGIYPPSRGELAIRGRITPLIEMGAGFHHELTGRENLFLNGAILGAPRKAILEHMRGILEFAEIDEHFLDTPIKYYSTGMRTRLAFGIAMELEPQIVILDEIFSNADAHFVQKACARLEGSASAQQILLLVSHDLELIRRLARRCLWIKGGGIEQDGPVEVVVSAYEAAMRSNGSEA